MTETTMDCPSAGYSVTVRLKIENIPGTFLRVVQEVAQRNASMSDLSLIYSDSNIIIRDITVNCLSEEQSRALIDRFSELDGITLLKWQDDTFELHRGGKLSVESQVELKTADQLSRAYTPGVARVCLAIEQEQEAAYDYTMKGNTVAVITDGSAVLGLGNIGSLASLPVMEGKAVLFKQFAGIDSFPICLATQDVEEVITAIKAVAPGLGGINLEDISAPRCFEIEDRLRQELDIPVFHDDQHGTAVVVLAGLFNALKITGKKLDEIKIVVNGFGAGGVACTRMLLAAGVKNIIPCDRAGAVYRGRTERMNPVKDEVIQLTNPDNEKGSVSEVLRGADVFIGVSKPGAITKHDVTQMAKEPIVFALSNPVPEIMPGEIRDVARIIATGRSDYPNQVNNVLCFPGIFRGALDARASDITEGMRLVAAEAIADAVAPDELSERYIIPSVFRGQVATEVANRVREQAIRDGVARIHE
ncbi:NAD-dependent malic enzyme [bacterium]|nr:NAD-dependent malic enzyme [bacterium]